MAGKLIKGILGALDEGLGTKLLGAEGRTLTSGAKILAKTPVRGILAKELTQAEVHPDIWNAAFGDPLPGNYAPLWRGFHGTNSRQPFDRPTGYMGDLGLSLTPSPDISGFHSVGRFDWSPDATFPVGAPGARTYPMLVDPGKSFPFPVDTKSWMDPGNVVSRTLKSPNLDLSVPHMEEVLRQSKAGRPLNLIMDELGYDSITYPHTNPWADKKSFVDPRDPSKIVDKGITIFDENRAVPEFSEVGQRAAKVRGVLSRGESVTEKKSTKELLRLYGTNATADEYAEFIFHPDSSRLGRMDVLTQPGMFDTPEEIAKNMMEIHDLAATMSPGARSDAIQNIQHLIDGVKDIHPEMAAQGRHMQKIIRQAKK